MEEDYTADVRTWESHGIEWNGLHKTGSDGKLQWKLYALVGAKGTKSSITYTYSAVILLLLFVVMHEQNNIQYTFYLKSGNGTKSWHLEQHSSLFCENYERIRVYCVITRHVKYNMKQRLLIFANNLFLHCTTGSKRQCFSWCLSMTYKKQKSLCSCKEIDNL